MIRRISLLVGISLKNIFQLNEAKYGRDPKKKRRAIIMLCAFGYLGVYMAISLMILSSQLIHAGEAASVPAMLSSVCCMAVFFLNVFGADASIFSERHYNMAASLPVSISEIVASRFISLYAVSLLYSAIAILPGSVVYGLEVGLGLPFALMTLLGALVLPLIPLALSIIVGAVVQAVSVKLRAGAMLRGTLSMLVILGIMGIMLFSPMDGASGAMLRLAEAYPPVKLYAAGVSLADWGSFLLFMLVSVGIFAVFAVIVRRFYPSLIGILNAKQARGNFEMSEQGANGQLSSLYKREIKRFFSCGIYLMNTGIGYILTAVIGIVMFVLGAERIGGLMGGISQLGAVFPFVLCMMAAISPTTSCSISLEGKSLWILKSMPVSDRFIYGAKLLLNMTIALPCVIIGSVFSLIALKLDFLSSLFVVIIPIFYVAFTSVTGLYMNLRMPMLDWENETVPVKQSSSVGFCVLAGMASVIIPAIVVALVPADAKNIALGAVCVILAAMTALIWRLAAKTSLKSID